MKTRTIILLVFFCFLIINAKGQQLSANFTSNLTEGCSPARVVFTNLSSPATGLNYFWDFGNGSTSIEANPTILYTSTGTYDVKLIISDGIKKDTLIKQKYISVFEKPVPDFTTNADKTGCAPYQVAFQNNTKSSNENISLWHWDFGDGTISNDKNPVHTYNYQDSYSVSLYVKDKNNCENFIILDKYISVFKPVSAFSCFDSVSCNGTLQTSFVNKSIGFGELRYVWNFGNGLSSTLKNPQVFYNQKGIYDLSLTTIDEHSCSDTLIKKGFIAIEKLTASISSNKDTVCPNESIILTNTSNIIQKSRWDFGDGSFSESTNPTHTYTSAGNYEIKLTATIDAGCSNTIVKKINVEKVVADFTSSQSFSCQDTVIVNYTDNSINAYTWDWRFGNKVKSSLKNPNNTYLQIGTYVDTLVVTSKHGCKSTKVVNPGLIIDRPKASFTPNNWTDANELKGCTPLTVNFKDNSGYITKKDSIIKWEWDFEDGSTSTSKNPSHTFQGTKLYQVSLKISTAKGCVSYYGANVQTGSKQNANFTKDAPDIICASTPVQFTDKSESQNSVNEWYWKFGDGTTSVKQNPLHIFADTGYMEVKLIVYHNGCPDDEIKSKFIYIKGPVLNPDYSTTCANPLSANFKSNSINADKVYWNFGDKSPVDSINASPKHSYMDRGDYKLNVKAVNISTGCSFESQRDVLIRKIKAKIEVDKAVGCPGATISFNPKNSTDQYSYEYKYTMSKYLWSFGDGSEAFNSSFPYMHKFDSKGIYNVKLKVKDFRGCEDSATQQIKIFKPEPNFSADNFVGCMPMRVDFKNNTKTDTTIVQWNWEFGDKSVSIEKNPKHIYTKFGIYDVSLSVVDQLGCSNTLVFPKFIEALKPSPDFTASDRTICIGDTISFTCQAKDKIKSYLWNFGDGSVSTTSNPNHSYNKTGPFNITLSIVDEQGCDSTRTVNAYIDIQKPPKVDFVVDKTYTNCYPLIVNFTDKSIGTNIAKWEWRFDENQASSHIQNPIHTYSKPGFYDVSLKATTSYGCIGSISKDNLIEVKGPWVKINAPDTICKNSKVSLSATNKSNVYDLLWFFNDGTTAKGDSVTHLFNSSGIITPALLVMSDELHTCDKYLVDTLFMKELKASIYESENNQSGCVPFSINFINQSIGAKSFAWTFGDGGISKQPNSLYTYQKEGVFNARLIVSDNFGCTDTTNSKITVHALPKIQIIKDTTICRGNSIQLWASGAKSYNWSPAQDLNSDDISKPVSTPINSIKYEVMAIDSNNCVNYSNVNIAVQQVPVITVPDTTIIIGEIVKLNASDPELLSYKWSPIYALSSSDKPAISAQPLESTTYTLTVVDKNKCFTVRKDININVRKEYTVDVPSAFSPNGDGINDKVFVKGWGVKDVIDFKIYNRFGELVFESHDKNEGWDGFHGGNNQNIETYTYYVKVRTFEDEIIDKTGSIKLLK